MNLEELELYGSSRLGVKQVSQQMSALSFTSETGNNYRVLGLKQYELSNHLGNVLSVISDQKLPQFNAGTLQAYKPVIVSSQDYYPFGMVMKERSSNLASDGYRFGFNGKENDNEVKGIGNSLDFGARVYDSRLGRWLACDPKFSKFPSLSPYSYAVNSPILYVDYAGEYPKVAIILSVPNKVSDFLEHKAALEKQGYVVVFASTGKEALEKMAANSSPDSPTESLVILSHGSPGGPNAGVYGTGIMTNMELESMSRENYENINFDKYMKENNVITDYSDPNYNQDAYNIASDKYYSYIDGEFEKKKEQIIEEYKNKNSIITSEDVLNSISRGNFSVKNLSVVFGGCNIGGYSNKPEDTQDIFAIEFAKTTKSTTYASEGYTEPDRTRDMKTKDKIGVTTDSRRSTGTWVEVDSNGNKSDMGKKSLNLTSPK